MIGSYGGIYFETSDSRILTPQKLKQKVSGQWSEHKLIGAKSKKEFNGADLRQITFTITFDIMLGVRPRQMLETLEWMIEEGMADYMVIGNKAMGQNKFVITNASEAWDTIYNGGELAKATVDVTMEEYVDD